MMNNPYADMEADIVRQHEQAEVARELEERIATLEAQVETLETSMRLQGATIHNMLALLGALMSGEEETR